jgi:hypothetical protein
MGLDGGDRGVTHYPAVPARDEHDRLPRFLTPEQEKKLRAAYYITPSDLNAWFGSWHEGHVLTAQQVRKLQALLIDPATVDTMDVQVAARNREWVWGASETAPIRLIACPIIGRGAERIRVIAPHGEVKLVYPGGHLRRPRTPPTGRRRTDA